MAGRFTNLELRDDHQQEEVAFEEPRKANREERDYLAQADEAYRWGRFETALRLYTRCLEDDRAVIPAWVGQVQMLVQLGEYQEARLWSDKALELFRDHGDLLAAKAQACARLKDYRAALACSDASLHVPGSSPSRWQARGEVLLAKGQRYHEESFQKSLTEKQADWFDRVVIARIYLFYRRATNALHHLKAAAEMEPARVVVWFEMGNGQAALGLTSAARTSYERCLELHRDYREAQKALDALESLSFFAWLWGLLSRGMRR
jgi:tetratricopeptide (TPR) repeat protein